MPIRFLSMRYASAKAKRRSASVPSAGTGSGTPQCALIASPGQTGQLSLAASSQTVKTKSSNGALGVVNSSQLLERRPATGWFNLRNRSSA